MGYGYGLEIALKLSPANPEEDIAVGGEGTCSGCGKVEPIGFVVSRLVKRPFRTHWVCGCGSRVSAMVTAPEDL